MADLSSSDPATTRPRDPAIAILAWLATRDLAAVQRDLPAAEPMLLAHAEVLADAADSDDETERNAGLAALFGGLVEPLNDSFTPAGRLLYHRLFGHVVWRVAARTPALRAGLRAAGIDDEAALLARHASLRQGGAALPATVRTVAVLSRVTIGADILLTSVVLQRVRQRWPTAQVVLLGDGKLAGLFGGLPGVRVLPLGYARRGPLRERLSSWLTLRDALATFGPDLVVGPDSRLDQLGLLPVTATAAQYLLWENVRPEGTPARSLAEQLDQWLAQTLALPATPARQPRVALDDAATAQASIARTALGGGRLLAVKLDHGGNPAKALPRAGEVAVLRALRQRGWRILLDRGFGAAELANSDALLAELGWTVVDVDDSGKALGQDAHTLPAGSLATADVVRFHGSIAGWAAFLSCCQHALSYDSVGHHLAAALGVPVTVAFTGWHDPDFPIAWQPRGQAPATVVSISLDAKEQPATWAQVGAAVP